MYPVDSKFNPYRYADEEEPILDGPPVPTDVPPGPQKVEVLEERFQNRQELFHPEDAQPDWEEIHAKMNRPT